MSQIPWWVDGSADFAETGYNLIAKWLKHNQQMLHSGLFFNYSPLIPPFVSKIIIIITHNVVSSGAFTTTLAQPVKSHWWRS